MTFKIGDSIAHPMHGAGIIDGIESRKINGTEREYYILKLPVGDMVVMIPTVNTSDIGVRPIIKPEEAEEIINAIPDMEVSMNQNWNKRYRENMEKIKSGDLMEVAEVVKGLMSRDVNHNLSTGERKMLHSAKQILISEIVLSQCCSYEEVEERINNALA